MYSHKQDPAIVNSRSTRQSISVLGASVLFALLGACSNQSSADAADHESEQEHVGEHDEHDEHEDGEPLELTPSQSDAAGIQLFRVGPGMVEQRLVLPAVVEADTNAISHVTPRISGVVSAVHMGLGQRVERGDVMCVIDSVELGGIVADYLRDQALAKTSAQNLAKEQELFRTMLASALSALDGTIELRQNTVDRERKLREQQVSTIRPLLDAEIALGEARLAKTNGLNELKSKRDARLLTLEAIHAERAITEASSLGRLSALGLTGADLTAVLEKSGASAGSYTVHAQRSGVIIKRLLSVGQFVPVGTELFEIQDMSKVWVVASAFEGSLRKLKGGQDAEVRLHAFPGTVIPGEVVTIHYSVDSETRALALRIELQNGGIEAWTEDFPLRPGMFGDVSLVIDAKQALLTLPEAAIVHDSGIDAVFVQVKEGHFEKRIVEVLGGDAELVEVRPVLGTGGALQSGDMVAVGGTFTLKSMDQAEDLVGHEH